MFAMSSPFPQCQDDATLTRGLAELQKDWAAIQAAEAKQRVLPEVKGIVDCVWWFPPIREVIVACAETEFKAVPRTSGRCCARPSGASGILAPPRTVCVRALFRR